MALIFINYEIFPILQINCWFINKRKRNKHLINNASNTSVDFESVENVENELFDEVTLTAEGTTVELEVVIQPDSIRKRRPKKVVSPNSDLPAICDVCGKTFTHRYMLQSHLKRHDPSTWEQCDICHRSFPDGLKRHMRVHSGERYSFMKIYLEEQC